MVRGSLAWQSNKDSGWRVHFTFSEECSPDTPRIWKRSLKKSQVMLKRTALLFGGSGLTGRHCLDYLLNDEHYSQVDAVVRRPLSVEHPKLIQHQVSFDRLKDVLPKIQAKDVYCCLGTTIKKAGSKKAFHEVDFIYPAEIAKLSIANGAEQFLSCREQLVQYRGYSG